MAATRRSPRRRAVRLVVVAAGAAAVVAMARGFAAAFVGTRAGPSRVAARDASGVAVGFFGGQQQQTEAKPQAGYKAYEATDVTPADQAKALWENPTVQSVVSFLMAASTVLDVAGFFTGEAGTTIGITEALASVDASSVATEGQAAVEALTQGGDGLSEAAQAVQEGVEGAQEGGESIFDIFKGPSSSSK